MIDVCWQPLPPEPQTFLREADQSPTLTDRSDQPPRRALVMVFTRKSGPVIACGPCGDAVFTWG